MGDRLLIGGADGEGEGGAAVGVALGGVGGSVGVLAVADDLLHLVEVFADVHIDGDAQADGRLEGTAQAGEELALEGGGEGAELEFAEGVLGGLPAAEALGEVVAAADARAGVVEADVAGLGDARGEEFLLARGGETFEDEHLARPEDVADLLEGPADGGVVHAAEVDAAEELGAAFGGEELGVGEGGGRGALGLGDEVVGQEGALAVEELAHKLLRPGGLVADGRAEFRDVHGEAAADGILDGGFVDAPLGSAFGDDLVEAGAAAALAIGGGEEAHLLLAAAQGVGDRGEDGLPRGVGIVEEGELGEGDVCREAADGIGLAGDADDAGLVGEEDGGVAHQRAGGLALLEDVGDGEAEGLGPLLALGEALKGLALGGGGVHPGGAGAAHTVGHDLAGAGEVLADLAGGKPDLPASGVVVEAPLVGQEQVDGALCAHSIPKISR